MLTEEMKICSERVRGCACNECLHGNECAAKGAPVSRLGKYWAKMILKVIPEIDQAAKDCLKERVSFYLNHANAGQFALGYIARLTMKIKGHKYGLLLTGEEEARDLWEEVALRYCHIVRKIKRREREIERGEHEEGKDNGK